MTRCPGRRVNRWAPLATLALLAIAPGARAADPAPPVDPVGDLSRSMLAADTIQVSRFWLDWRDSSVSGARQLISLRHRLSLAPVKPPWMKRFAAALFPPGTTTTQVVCPVLEPEAPGPGPWLASVNWTSKSGRGQAILDLVDRCAYLALPGAPPASVEVHADSSAARLLELLREALPADAALHAPGAGRVLTAAATDTILPGYDELVRAQTAPVCTTNVAPAYPDSARVAGIQGTVVLKALVDRNGIVRGVRIATSVPGLDGAAAEAVRQWRFKPATFRQRPLAVWVSVPVTFHLH